MGRFPIRPGIATRGPHCSMGRSGPVRAHTGPSIAPVFSLSQPRPQSSAVSPETKKCGFDSKARTSFGRSEQATTGKEGGGGGGRRRDDEHGHHRVGEAGVPGARSEPALHEGGRQLQHPRLPPLRHHHRRLRHRRLPLRDKAWDQGTINGDGWTDWTNGRVHVCLPELGRPDHGILPQ